MPILSRFGAICHEACSLTVFVDSRPGPTTRRRPRASASLRVTPLGMLHFLNRLYNDPSKYLLHVAMRFVMQRTIECGFLPVLDFLRAGDSAMACFTIIEYWQSLVCVCRLLIFFVPHISRCTMSRHMLGACGSQNCLRILFAGCLWQFSIKL